jgi:predicted flap endonuclease-1-like 5' DNA nuclease
MPSTVLEQIAALERERVRLEGHLAEDENWLALMSIQKLNGSAPPEAVETERLLRRLLAANPYYSARVKIVEAITILRRLGSTSAAGAAAAAANAEKEPIASRDGEEDAPGAQPEASPRSALGIPLGVPFFGEDELPPRNIEDDPSNTGQASADVTAASQSSATVTLVADAQVPQPGSLLATELEAIKGVTPELAQQLAKLGVSRLVEVAGWTAEDVKRVAGALALGRSISKQNWIEQAALLAHRNGIEARHRALGAEPDGHAGATATAPEINARQDEASAIQNLPEVPLDKTEAQSTVAVDPTLDVAASVLVTETRCDASVEAEAVVEPEPAPVAGPIAAAEPALSPRDWLAQRRGAATMPRSTPVSLPAPEVALPAQVHVPQAPPPLPVSSAAPAHEDPQLVSVSGFAGAHEAEVSITKGPALSVPGFSGALPAMRSLRTRLSGLVKPAGVDSGEHASYRGHVEEASVEIVRRSAAGDAPGVADPSHPPESRLVSRFLKALKGKE